MGLQSWRSNNCNEEGKTMKDIDKVISWYETLSEKNLESIGSLYAHSAFFKDPFNEVTGRESIEHIFRDMFKQLKNPKFIFKDKFQESNQAFTTWDFTFMAKGKNYSIHGSTHLKFNNEGLVVYHRDYWDVGEEVLLKVPFVRSLYGILRKKIGSH